MTTEIAPDGTLTLEAKKHLSLTISDLMPFGNPDYRQVITRPTIHRMIAENGKKEMHKALYTLIMDFCRSLNVVRPMDEMQAVEAATMLMDECCDYRIEDYMMMFTMAKRGKLVKILDRIDIQVIGQMMQEYWAYRDARIENIEVIEHRKRKADESFITAPVTPEEIKASKTFSKLLKLFREAPEPERKGIGTRAKEELSVTDDARKTTLDRLAQRQLEKLAQIKYYQPGLKISWISHRMDKKHRLYGVQCHGEIEDMRGDTMVVIGTDTSGKPVKDYVALNDLTIKIIR